MNRFEPVLESVWTRRFVLLLLGATLVRVAYAAWAPLDLSPDEAYYWDWSRRLDVCYYSKPPLVAWIIAAFTRPLGSTTFTVRLPAALLGAVTLWAIFATGRRMFGARAGFLAALASLAGPASCALGLTMTIDPPLVALWSATVYFLWRATEADGRLSHWLATTVALAGGLASKATMLVFLPLWPLLVRGRARSRPWFLPILPLLGALAVLGVILAWNASHDWVMFQHSAGHFTGERRWIVPTKFLEFLAAQLGLVSPVLGILCAAVLGCQANRRALADRRIRFAFLLGGPPLAAILLLSLHQRVHPNWSAPFYPTTFVLVGAWAAGALEAPRGLRGWWRPGLVLGFALVAVTYAFAIIARYTELGGSRIDPTARIRGWSELGTAVSAIRSSPAGSSSSFLSTLDRQVASELAFYLPDQPTVYRWTDGPVRTQYELWPQPHDRIGEDSLVVVLQEQLPEAFRACFREIVPLGTIETPLGRTATRTFRVFLARELRSWPDPLE